MSQRFPKTVDKIRELFPNTSLCSAGQPLLGATDVNKSLRHELYVFIHSIPLGKDVPLQSNVQDFEFSERDLTHKEYLKLVEVNKVYADERAQLQSLPEFIAETVALAVSAKLEFSAFDMTSAIRQVINHSPTALLNDRDYEDLEIVEGSGVKGLTQKIPHAEVRAILNDLFEAGKLPGYEKVRTGKYFTYRPIPVPVYQDPDGNNSANCGTTFANRAVVAVNKQSGIFQAVPGTQAWRDAIGNSPDPFKDSAMARAYQDQKNNND